MDPVTMLGGVAAAVQLAGTTANIGLQLYRFYCDVKNAPEKSKELCDEISDLSSVINDLAQTLKAADNTFDVPGAISNDSLQKYSQFLMDISSRIQLNKRGLKKRLKWPLSTKENEDLIAKIERYKATFTLALETANLKQGSAHAYPSHNT